MKLTSKKRKSVAASEKISGLIQNDLSKNKSEDKKVDVTKIAEDLASRRERVLRENEEN